MASSIGDPELQAELIDEISGGDSTSNTTTDEE